MCVCVCGRVCDVLVVSHTGSEVATWQDLEMHFPYTSLERLLESNVVITLKNSNVLTSSVLGSIKYAVAVVGVRWWGWLWWRRWW